jgi:hypothetical protein
MPERREAMEQSAGNQEQPIQPKSVLEAALSYAQRGWSIVPVERGTKRPAVDWKQYQQQCPAVDQLRHWFGSSNGSRPEALAVIVGPVSGGLACRDFDIGTAFDAWADKYHEYARNLPTARTQRGCHVWFRLPKDSTLSGIKKHSDGELRLSGGICPLPPSKHPGGHAYEWIVPLPDGAMPEIDPAEIGLVGTEPAEASTTTTTAGNPIREGSRSDTLTSLAGAMRCRGMSEAAICAALLAENATRCAPPLDEAEVRRIAQSVGKYPSSESANEAADDPHRLARLHVCEAVCEHGLAGLPRATRVSPLRLDWRRPQEDQRSDSDDSLAH